MPRASKNEPKWTPEWSLWALKITKIHHIQNSKKRSNHKTVKNGLLCSFREGSAKALFSIKTHIHLRNPEKKCPGPRNDCPGLKIYPQAFKITAHLGVETPRRSTPRAQRNGTVPGYARSALDMFHIFSLVCFLIYGVTSRSGHDEVKSYLYAHNYVCQNVS